ncbi:MAG TPA: GAF domain-containing protein [Anaerolineales bacterium]|nr:GAF domain-containing protein [Anaerolineales bacterium]
MNKQSSSLPSQSTESYSYITWRERFLKVILQGSCAVGGVAILLYLRFAPSTPGIKLLAAMTYGVLVLVTVLTNIPYRVRAGVFLLLLYFAGLSSLLDYGLRDAAILFLGFTVMTGLLFPLRWGTLYAMGFSFLSLLVFGGEGVFSIAGGISIVIFMVVSAIAAIGLHNSQEDFTKTQEAAQQMLGTLHSEHSTLEQQVEERTVSLNQKSEQLRATSYIARKTAEVQDLASLLNMVARLVTDQLGFYHTGVFLINETGDQAVLQAASSEGGQRMIERGHALSVGTQGIVGYVAAQKKPRIALDVGSDAVFFNNPDLPMTRSEVALPLMVRNKVLGVLDIQSEKPQAFTPDDIDVLQTLSDQVAIAIENARLLDETHASIIQLEALTNLRTRESWRQKLHEKSRVFTYTPLGLRAEKLPQNEGEAISAPIILRGQKIGNISIARKGDAAWSRLDRELIEEVASQVGLAVDNIRLLEEATERAKQEQTIGKLAARFSQSLDLDTLLQTAARELGQLPDVSDVSVFIGQETQQTAQSKQRSRRNVS